MYHFIVNPAASSGMGRKVWKEIKPILKEKNVEYSLNVFKNEEEMADFVRTLTSGKDPASDVKAEPVNHITESSEDMHIVVLGGDGTLNLVLNSMVDMEHTKLSCIRVGSGNDFARNVGVEKDAGKALLHLLNEPREIELDYGEVSFDMPDGKQEDLRFIISSGIGYDADICEEVSGSRLKKILNALHLGKLVYVAIGIKQIFTRNNAKAKLYLDDNEPIRVNNLFFTVGMIHEMEGGGVPFCPHADPCDGMLDVCVAKGAPIPKLLLEVAMVYFKKHLLFSNISEYRCRKLRIVTDKPQWIHMDGETPCRVTEAEFRCKQGVRFVK